MGFIVIDDRINNKIIRRVNNKVNDRRVKQCYTNAVIGLPLVIMFIEEGGSASHCKLLT